MRASNPIYLWSITFDLSSFDCNEKVKKEWEDLIKIELCKISKRVVIGREFGDKKGKEHFQCFVSLVQKSRFPISEDSPLLLTSSFKDKNHIVQCQPAFDKFALDDYCRKSDNIEVDWVLPLKATPIFPPISLTPLQVEIDKYIEAERNSRTVFIFCDPAGNSGKTYFIKSKLNSKYPTLVLPSLGTVDSVGATAIRSLNFIMNEKITDRIYVFLDVTRTSPIVNRAERRLTLCSLIEGLVSGLCSVSFGGKLSTFYAPAGLVIPIIFTNEDTTEWYGTFSHDRERVVALCDSSWHVQDCSN